jgi:CheY-like chemotaxis protein
MKARVLNVNDNPALRYVVSRMLTAGGFEVLEAEDGRGALAQARATPPPQVVVLDVHLPDMDGFAVCRQLRADAATAGLKVLHTSATILAKGEAELSRAAGGDAYLPQPFEPATLVAEVQALLNAAGR